MDLSDQSDKKKESKDELNKEAEPADFETAMDAAGFGVFNIILLIISFAATCANNFETSTMSYILPIAECDLKLTLLNKGTLNAATYMGMIISAVFWGYLADTQGRKKILVIGYLLDFVCVICSSLSQNFEMLVTFKFLGGFIANGPGAVLFTYVTELHGAKHRPRVLMMLGILSSFATLILPLLAWGIFPQDWDFVIFGNLDVHSWQIYLAVCSLPSLIAGLATLILPESPKFLMSQGRNMEALRSLQTIYAFNTRKPKNTFPIKTLVEEVPNRERNTHEAIFTIDNKPMKLKVEHRSLKQSFRDGMKQIKPMFRKPLLGRSLHLYTMQFCILLGLNTIRLWLPQLFASIAEYEALESTKEGSSNLCNILEYSVNKTQTNIVSASECTANTNVSMDMYINNIIVSISGLVGYCLAGFIIRAIGSKNMMTFSLIISGLLGIGLYWSVSGLSTLIISSAFVTIASISIMSLLSVVLTLFPTSLRTIIVCLAMMFGRLGALSGNLLFPVLVELGCIPPFLMVSSVMMCAAALSIILPSAKKATFT